MFNETNFTGDYANVGDIEVGNIVITGTLSIAGDLNVPGELSVAGSTTLQAVTATSVSAASMTINTITTTNLNITGNAHIGTVTYTNQIEPQTTGSTLIVGCDIDNSDPNDAVHRVIKTGSLITMYGIDNGGIMGNAGDAGTSFYFSNSSPGDFCIGGLTAPTQLGTNLNAGTGKSNLTLTASLTTANLPVSIADTTNSTSTATGSIVTAGGMGVALNAYFGGSIVCCDATTPQGRIVVVPSAGGYFIGDSITAVSEGDLAIGTLTSKFVHLGIGIDGGTNTPMLSLFNDGSKNVVRAWNVIHADGGIEVTNTTQSTSATTGALTVDGGVGVLMNIYAGESIYVNENVNVTGTVAPASITFPNATGATLSTVLSTYFLITIPMIFTGPYSTGITVNVIFERIGKTVKCLWPNISGNCSTATNSINGYVSATGSYIPSYLVGSSSWQSYQAIVTYDFAGGVYYPGMLAVLGTGQFIFRKVSQANFTSSNEGIVHVSVGWTVDN
jgi:hypothetical protein